MNHVLKVPTHGKRKGKKLNEMHFLLVYTKQYKKNNDKLNKRTINYNNSIEKTYTII